MVLIFKVKFPLAMSLVSSCATPAAGFVSPVTISMEVLLPAPLCPRNPKTSPGGKGHH